ncbi:MAG: hypothetical protein WBK55_07080 [Alphaproteobacteria bacterium]
MTKKLRTSRFSLILCSVLTLAIAAPAVLHPRPAYACGICIEGVVETELEQWIQDIVGGTYWRVSRHVRSEFVAQKVWLVSVFWEDNLLPALMLMADQLTAVAMQQMQIVGSLMDAKQQLETQQTLQRIAARTHKDYQPSVGLCEFGSNVKSLSMSEIKADMNTAVMSQRSQDRQLGAINTAAAIGEDGDKKSRLKQFREKYCDPRDNNNGLNYLCDWDQQGTPGPDVGGPDPKRLNKDIDFGRTVDQPWTLVVDMVFPELREELTEDEEDIFALASNLYGHEVFVRPPARSLEPIPTQRITNLQKIYLDMRSIVAKQAVAENSFNAVTGMKTEGTAGSYDFLRAMLEELGLSSGEAHRMLNSIAPSYYAQMEVLTRKIYQNPDFYTNLYDKPTNVDRKRVAMDAIGLMQKFDLFKSNLRSEATLSVLLEQAVVELQGEVENEMNQMTGE